MLNLGGILLFSDNHVRLIEFYEKIFQRKADWSGGDFKAFNTEKGYLCIGPHSEVHDQNKEPGRFIFNFETEDVAAEFKRLKALGAKVVKEPYNPSEDPKETLATLTDPDGNYFQIGTPFEG